MEKEQKPLFLDKSIGHQLGRAYNRFWRMCAKRLQPHRLTPKQFSLLSLICLNPNISQSDICRRLESKAPQIADLLETLVARKFITRRAAKEDRRRRLWMPTAAGIDMERQLQRKVIDAEQQIFAECGLSMQQRDWLFDLLFQITDDDDNNGPLSETDSGQIHQLRRVAGSFATGVTIISRRHKKGIHGMTANSFLSVSLSPPLVLFSLQKKVKMQALLHVGAPIGISILSRDQQHISDHFANRGSVQENMFEEETVPTIKDAHATYHVVLEDIIAAGDHELFICRVQSSRQYGGEPLLFHAGDYATLSQGEKQ